MRRVLIAAVAVAMAAPASAQWVTHTGRLDVPYIPPVGSEYAVAVGDHVTPTMKRQKIAAADKLRAEVQTMLARNDGELSRTQIAYIRRQVSRIRGE